MVKYKVHKKPKPNVKKKKINNKIVKKRTIKKKKEKTKYKNVKDDPLYQILSKNIKKYKNNLWIPKNPKFEYINKHKFNAHKRDRGKLNTWFKINKFESKNINEHNKLPLNLDEPKGGQLYKALKIKLILKEKQKQIIDSWLEACITMYNRTIKYLKYVYRKGKDLDKEIIMDRTKCFLKDLYFLNTKIIYKKKQNTKKKSRKKNNKEEPIQDIKEMIIPEILSTKPNEKNIRTYILIHEKQKIINSFKENEPPSHVMDGAIKLACANYKSAMTNLKDNNIKHFRMRYWKYNKNKKIMDVETLAIGSSIFPSWLGQIKFKYDGKVYNNFNNIKYYGRQTYIKNDLVPDYFKNKGIKYNGTPIRTYVESKGLKNKKFGKILDDSPVHKQLKNIKYGSEKILCNMSETDIGDSRLMKENNTYYLFVPIKIKKENIDKKNKIIAIDPGIRNFITGISENEEIQIGNDVRNKIKGMLLDIDEINNKEKICNKKKKLIRKRKKLENMIDELHWKTIKYLTDNYETILIGDLSAKGICSKESSKLDPMTKRVAYMMSFYKLRKRLAYKCELKKCKYKKVDEHHTSKTCSFCANYNRKLGKAEIYKCKKCKKIMGRDENGARNIYFASIIIE